MDITYSGKVELKLVDGTDTMRVPIEFERRLAVKDLSEVPLCISESIAKALSTLTNKVDLAKALESKIAEQQNAIKLERERLLAAATSDKERHERATIALNESVSKHKDEITHLKIALDAHKSIAANAQKAADASDEKLNQVTALEQQVKELTELLQEAQKELDVKAEEDKTPTKKSKR